MSTTPSYDETLSTDPPISNETMQAETDLTNYLLAIFPFYACALFFNFLSIYSILVGKIYRQYLSNVLLAVICIGALLNVHGHMFLILLRWTNNSVSNQLCSSSIYLRDSGAILIHTHIFILAIERIIANLKKHPQNLHNSLLQKAHLFLIIVSFICILLSFTVPIYTFTHSNFSDFDGLCVPLDGYAYKLYFNWIYFGFGHPLIWTSFILLGIFLWRKTTISYSTLSSMNKIILIINLSSCSNLIMRTLLDDFIGIGSENPLDITNIPSKKLLYLMNLRDTISILVNLLIGLAFFLFRPEIRSWLYASIKRFQGNTNVAVTPQMLDIRNEIDDQFPETDDENLHFRSDT